MSELSGAKDGPEAHRYEDAPLRLVSHVERHTPEGIKPVEGMYLRGYVVDITGGAPSGEIITQGEDDESGEPIQAARLNLRVVEGAAHHSELLDRSGLPELSIVTCEGLEMLVNVRYTQGERL
jgi:hypothetical protein